MLDQMAPQQLAAAMEDAASDILREASCRGPAVDALRLAQRLGLTVARDRSLNGRARFARLAVGRGRVRGAIFVGEADRPERLQWAVAHELGEIYARRVFSKLDVAPREQSAGTREHFANELARRILLPRAHFQSVGGRCDWDLFEMKRAFPSASHELIARRMLDMPAPLILTVCDQRQITWRRGNHTASPPALNPQERLLARVAHETNEYQAQQAAGLSIRAWPIHEPGWKREILRTEPLEDA